MKSTRNYLILVLSLIVVGGGALAWQQYQELLSLRASALSSDDRAALQKRVWDAEKRARELEAKLAAAQRGDAEETATAADGTAPGAAGPAGRGGRANMTPEQIAQLQAVLQSPQVQSLMAIEQKAALNARYAALIRNLNLTPEQGDKLKSLIADRQSAQQDAAVAAREAGVNPRQDPQGYQKLIADAQAQSNDNIKSLLGDDGYAALQQYDQTVPQRNVVNQLQQQLSYTTPLSSEQSEQLVQILAASSPQGANGGGQFGGGGGAGFAAFAGAGGFGGFAGRGGGGTQITTAALAQAQAILNPAQFQALQQLQQTQQAQQQVQQILQQNGAGGRGGRRGGRGGGG